MSSITVKLIDGLRETEVWDVLDEHSLRGTRIPGVINRYSVEVPTGKEAHFSEILKQTSGVISVSYTKEQTTANSKNNRYNQSRW